MKIEERREQTFINRLCRTTSPFALPIFLPLFSLGIFLVWLGGGEFVSVSNLHELRVWMDFAFDLHTTFYFEAL